MKPDLYAILGVNPNDDTATIEAALARQQPAWASGTRNPKRKHEYQSYLDLIPEIRKTLLGDPYVRAAYDAERAAGLRVERDRKLDELQLHVRMRAAKGGLTPADRARLDDKAKALGLNGDDLAKLVHAYPEVADSSATYTIDEPDEGPPPNVLDPTTRRQIRVALEHLKKLNLYDVLDLPYDASPAEVVERADEERTRWMQKAQVTAEKTAWLEAVSYAQTHLGTNEARNRYDWTLIIEAEEVFAELVGFTIDGLHRLDDTTRGALLDEATSRGLVPERAERLIRRICQGRGVGTSHPASPETDGAPAKPARLLRCRSCGGITPFTIAARGTEGQAATGACRHCDASLRWDCPICSQTRWVDQPKCACGFLQERRGPLLRHFEAAQNLFRARDYPGALAHLDHVLGFAPNHRASNKAKAKVKEIMDQARKAKHFFETARAQKKLVAARAALDAWGRLVDPSSAEFTEARDDLFQQLREALSLAAEGRGLTARDPAGARVLFHKALKISIDLAEAREGLQSCPLDPPSDLQAEIDGHRVHLTWRGPNPDGLGPVSFRVVRQRGRVPAHARDGKTVAEVAEPEAFDHEPPSGEPVGYAVFSRRSEVESLTGPSVGPLLVLAEADVLKVDERDGEVELRWAVPPGAGKVRVVRKERAAPQGPDDGTRLDHEGSRLLDRGLKNDETYHYALFAIYPVAGGKARASRGVLVSATPHPRIEGVGAIELGMAAGGAVRLNWTRPARGQVKIIRSPRPLPHPLNTEISAAEAANLSGQWLEVAGPDQVIDPDPPRAGLCHYTPMTVWNGSMVVGKSVAYSCLPDPTDLRALRIGPTGKAHLRWRWTPHAPTTLVVLKSGSYAHGPDDPEAHVITVEEREYGRDGSFSLTLPAGPGPWHVSIHSVAMVEGERVVSSGLDPTSRTIIAGPNPDRTLTYVLKKPLFPGRPWTITLFMDPPDQPVPATALVAQARTVPLSLDDGEIVARFPAGPGGRTLPIPANGVDLGKHRVRLFEDPLATPEGTPPTRIRHPESESTRV
mgnify:CR=1 FL=1